MLLVVLITLLPLLLSLHGFLELAESPPTSSCRADAALWSARTRLAAANITARCSALDSGDCVATLDRLTARATDVADRSQRCQLDWAEWDEVSPAELAFPLAYFITAYTDARQLELLLATVFRPHNAYCIHVDSKADPEFQQTVRQLVDCYTARHPAATILLPAATVPVHRGHFSVGNIRQHL